MTELIFSVLPLIISAVGLVVFIVVRAQNKKRSTRNYLAEGMAVGMCFGAAITAAFHTDIAMGVSVGMLVGEAVGASFRKKAA